MAKKVINPHHLPPHLKADYRTSRDALKELRDLARSKLEPTEIARFNKIKAKCYSSAIKGIRTQGRILLEKEYEVDSSYGDPRYWNFLVRKKSTDELLCTECGRDILAACIFFIQCKQEKKEDTVSKLGRVDCRDCFEDYLKDSIHKTRYIWGDEIWLKQSEPYTKVLEENPCFKDGPCNAVHMTRAMFYQPSEMPEY